ncbi:hypothetical protein B0E54_06001 [Micromonospora sp. MH99]|nr:hypothetical protein [Micromonospora sp. MH99]
MVRPQVGPGEEGQRAVDHLVGSRVRPRQPQTGAQLQPVQPGDAGQVDPGRLRTDRLGLVPPAQRDERLGPVGQQVRPGRAADPHPPRLGKAGLGRLRGLGVAAQLAEHVRLEHLDQHEGRRVPGRLGHGLGTAQLRQPVVQLLVAEQGDPRRQQDQLLAERLGVRARLGGDQGRLLRIDLDQMGGDVGEQPDALHPEGPAGRQSVRLVQLPPAVALAEQGHQPAPLVQQAGGAQRRGVGVHLGQSGAGQRDGATEVAGRHRRVQGLLQQRQVVHAEQVGRVGHQLPQLQRPFQQSTLLGVGVPVGGGAGRDPCGDKGAGVVVRRVPVVGDLGRGAAGDHQVRLGLDRGGEPRVQPGVLAGQQLVVHGLADQGVPELVVAVRVGHHQLGGDRGAQRVLQLGLGQAGDLGEQTVGEAGAAGRRDPQHPLGRLGQPVHPGQQQVAQCLGQRRAAERGAGDGQLLDEEGVALRTVVDVVNGTRRRLATEQVGEDRAGAVAVQPAQLDPLDTTGPVQLGEERAQRMAALQLVGAVGADQQQPARPRGPDQETDQVPGGTVRPVQVLDDQQQWPDVGEPLEQFGDQVEQVSAWGVGKWSRARGGQPRRHPAQLRQQAGELRLVAGEDLGPVGAQHRAQRGGERRERQARLTQLQALTDQHPGAPGGGRELLQQPGLAHARLATDQHGGRLALPGPARRSTARTRVPGRRAGRPVGRARARWVRWVRRSGSPAVVTRAAGRLAAAQPGTTRAARHRPGESFRRSLGPQLSGVGTVHGEQEIYVVAEHVGLLRRVVVVC